jgi:hypothetical protein
VMGARAWGAHGVLKSGRRCECTGRCGIGHDKVSNPWADSRCPVQEYPTLALAPEHPPRRLVLIAPGYGPYSAEGAAATGAWVLWCTECVNHHDRELARTRAEAHAAAQLDLFNDTHTDTDPTTKEF